METSVITESSLGTTPKQIATTPSPSHRETSHIYQITQGSVSYLIDTTSIEFRESLNLGCTQIGTASFRTTVLKHAEWVNLESSNSDPAIQAGGHELGEYLRKKIEANPQRAARLAAARKRAAQSLSVAHGVPGKASSLAELRMHAGMSQAQLAQKMNTQQPGIARWERAPASMQFDTMQLMANALNIEVTEVAATIHRQQTGAEHHAD